MHCYQDELGNWHTYTFGTEGLDSTSDPFHLQELQGGISRQFSIDTSGSRYFKGSRYIKGLAITYLSFLILSLCLDEGHEKVKRITLRVEPGTLNLPQLFFTPSLILAQIQVGKSNHYMCITIK